MTGYDDDGFDAMMASKSSREPIKRRDLAKIMSYTSLGSLKNTAIRIDYEDVDGISSKRWVTVKAVSKHRNSPPTMEAYCWVRRQNRTFRLDRIAEVAGCDGEVVDGETFFEGFGFDVASTHSKGFTPAHLSYPEPDTTSAYPYYRGDDDDEALEARLARDKRDDDFSGVSMPHSVALSQETLERCQRYAEERQQGTRQTSSTAASHSGFEAFSRAIPDKTPDREPTPKTSKIKRWIKKGLIILAVSYGLSLLLMLTLYIITKS